MAKTAKTVEEDEIMGDKPQVIIFSGFLGSGKTTLLVRLIERLRSKHGEGYRIAIIENEIGAASVDSSIIKEAGYSVTEMLSGCVCCTLIGQLVPAIQKLVDDLNPQLIILEATGLATPDTMANNIRTYGGCDTRIVTLVDASRWERIKRALIMLLQAQVEPADIVCINKIDLVDEAQIAVVEADVHEINATVPIVRASASQPMPNDDIDLIVGE